MIKATSDSQQVAPQTPPSFPTYNPAQQSKSMMKNTSLPPTNESVANLNTKNNPANVTSGGIITPPVTPSPIATTPAKPKFPDPTTKIFIKADGTKTDKNGDNSNADDGSNKKPKKKSNWKMALGAIILLLVILGTVTGFYLTQQSQDLRQQASEDINECPLAEACPHSNGTLIECDSNNVMDISECNSKGRIESCGGNEYCCPTAGGTWTTDMTACTTIEPVACNGTCTADEECSAAVAENFCDPATNKCRLETNPTSVTCEETTIPPISSYHDYADSTCRTYGWIIDSNISPDSSLIHVYADGSYGTGTFVGEYLANTVRTDLNNTNITGNHGFDITFNSQNTESPILFDGNPHELYIYGIDSQDPVNSNVLIENTPQTITCPSLTNAVSCDNITGTLTNETVVDETTEMTYEVTYSGEASVTSVDFVIHGNFEGPGWSDATWVTLKSDATPTDGIFSSSTTYAEMIDLLVDSGHDRQELLDKGIVYYANVNGPDGFCHADGVWAGINGTGETCDFNDLCTGTISIAKLTETAVACNESCTTDTECQLTNSAYTCDSISNKCRLDANKTSTTCELANDSSDDNSTATIACNGICTTNSDCSDTDHICVTTADGSNRCRLAAYTSSESCIIENSEGTTTATTQPDLPGELPETGPEDWLNWLKAGLVTMGIGTALFLLL